MISRRAIPTGITILILLVIASVARTQTDQGLREELHQTYPLKAGGRVSLKSVVGSVRIIAWDRNEVKVDAIKIAPSKEKLAEANIKIDASPGAVVIKTGYPDDCCFYGEDCCKDCCSKRYSGDLERDLATVEYILSVPRSTNIEAVELIKGPLTIEGVTGPVHASTIVGPLEARFDRLGATSPISLSSVSGNIALTIPSDTDAQVVASSLVGIINNNFGLTVRRGDILGRDLAGKLGNGQGRITVESVSGNINIRHPAGGRRQSVAINLEPEAIRTVDDKDEGVGTRAQRIARKARRDVQQRVREAKPAIIEAQREAARAAREASKVVIAIPEIDLDLDLARVIANIPIEVIQREVERATREIGRVRVHRGGFRGYRLSETETKTFPINGTPQVTLATFDGPITVKAWDKPEVMINATRKAGDEETMRLIQLKIEQRGAEIIGVAELDKSAEGRLNRNVTVHLDVYVPRSANMRVSSGDGPVRVEGVGGEIELHTDDGPIDVTNGRGRLKADTGDGQVQVLNFDGAFEVRTGDGPINLEGRLDGGSAHTGDGAISLTLPGDYNATIETTSESVVFSGLNVTEDSESSASKRRWKIGSGGKVFSLSTGDGRIILRRSGD